MTETNTQKKTNKNDMAIESSTAESVKVIKDAAIEASIRLASDLREFKSSLASAANDAKRTLAEAAADAVKVRDVKGDKDHDILIELRTRVMGLLEAINGISVGINAQITEFKATQAVLANRVLELEKTKGSQTTILTIGIIVLGSLATLLFYHLFKTTIL